MVSVPFQSSLYVYPFVLLSVCTLRLTDTNQSRHYQFAPDPVILDHRIKEFEARIELMRAVGAAAALRWGPKPQLPPTTPHATAARSHDGGEGCNEPASKQLQTFSSIPGLNDNQTKASNCREETLKRRAVTKNINNYAELDYGELLCAGSALGQNALPR